MDDKAPISIGVVGLGNVGVLHCSYVNQLKEAKLAAICDKDEANFDLLPPEDFDYEVSGLENIREKVSTFTDYEEMLDSKRVDLVIIAVPHYLHSPMAIKAFKRGVHVICEKPLAVTARTFIQ